MTSGLRVFRFASAVVLFAAAVSVNASSIDITRPEIAYWYNLIDSGIETVESYFGNGYDEISAEALNSRAERILWYKTGVTLWFAEGRVVQLRLDSNAGGSADGVRIGSSIDEIESVFGNPWIEDGGSLYYNLPWRNGPVRLRLVFSDMKLSEAYLYIVR